MNAFVNLDDKRTGKFFYRKIRHVHTSLHCTFMLMFNIRATIAYFHDACVENVSCLEPFT